MLHVSGLSDLDVCIHDGEVVQGFVEWNEYMIRGVRQGFAFVVDDEPLVRNGDGSYTWRPSFYAGRVRAELVDPASRTEAAFSFDVSPSPGKLGKPIFDKMLEELLAYRSGLALGSEAARISFGHEGTAEAQEIAFERLRQYGSPCIAALEAICRSPVARLQQDRRDVRRHQVRRVDTQTLMQLGRSPGISAFLAGEASLFVDDSLVSVPATTASIDNAANRAISSMTARLAHRCARLTDVYAQILLQPSHSLFVRAHRRLEVLAGFTRRLRRIRQLPLLKDISRTEVTAAGLNAIAAHPDYARGYQLAWKALRLGIEGDKGDDLLPLAPSWEIYERWCFIQVAQTFEDIFPEAKWREALRGPSVDNITLVGSLPGVTIEVRLQSRFPAWDRSERNPFRSLTAERIPDIVVTLDNGNERRLLILDAKYRSKRHNILDAMQTAHTYRDALRWHGIRPWRVLVMIPKGGEVAWLEDRSFQEENGIGAIEVRNSDNLNELRALVTAFALGDLNKDI